MGGLWSINKRQEQEQEQQQHQTDDDKIERLRQRFPNPKRVVQACVLQQMMQDGLFPERWNHERPECANFAWGSQEKFYRLEYFGLVKFVEYIDYPFPPPQHMVQLPQEMYDELFPPSEYVLK